MARRKRHGAAAQVAILAGPGQARRAAAMRLQMAQRAWERNDPVMAGYHARFGRSLLTDPCHRGCAEWQALGDIILWARAKVGAG